MKYARALVDLFANILLLVLIIQFIIAFPWHFLGLLIVANVGAIAVGFIAAHRADQAMRAAYIASRMAMRAQHLRRMGLILEHKE